MIYLLYDTALNGLYTLNLLKKAYHNNLSLFKGTKDENLFDAAPYLFHIDDKLFENINDQYVSLEEIVIVESDVKLNDLLVHFKYFIYQTIKGQQNYFRFWDARVLARFLPACTDEKLNSFFDGIKTFYVLDIEKATAKSFYISRAKLQSANSALNKLFVLPNDEQAALQNENSAEIKTDESKKIKREFFK